MFVTLLICLPTDLFAVVRFIDLPVFLELLFGVPGLGFLDFAIAGSLVTSFSSFLAIFMILVLEYRDLLSLSTGRLV